MKELREAGQHEEARKRMLRLAKESRTTPKSNSSAPGFTTTLGLEREGVPFYERALRFGPLRRRPAGGPSGWGSTSRCLGEYEKAATTLERGSGIPGRRGFTGVLAMALYNRVRHREAMEILLRLDTTRDDSIRSYEKAIRFYLDKLNQTWE